MWFGRGGNGCCPECGYSRSGLRPDAACPECGCSGPGATHPSRVGKPLPGSRLPRVGPWGAAALGAAVMVAGCACLLLLRADAGVSVGLASWVGRGLGLAVFLFALGMWKTSARGRLLVLAVGVPLGLLAFLLVFGIVRGLGGLADWFINS